ACPSRAESIPSGPSLKSGVPDARRHRLAACQSRTRATPEHREIVPRGLRRRAAIARDKQPRQPRHSALAVLAGYFPACRDQVFRHLRRGCEECTKYRLPIQADLRAHERRAARDERAFDPLPSAVAHDDDFLPDPAVTKFLAGMAATEADNVTADERCISLQDAARAEFGNRTVEDAPLLGQQLEERP